MRIWFDTEFLENGFGMLPDLISIGLVREDGASYYAEVPDARLLCNQSTWLVANVLPHLTEGDARRALDDMRKDVVAFAGEDPQFWAYYGATDWMLLLNLVGGFLQRPASWPGWCRELKQLISTCGNMRVPKQETGEHNALQDALWNKKVWEGLRLCNPAAANA